MSLRGEPDGIQEKLRNSSLMLAACSFGIQKGWRRHLSAPQRDIQGIRIMFHISEHACMHAWAQAKGAGRDVDLALLLLSTLWFHD